jgi:hypothetical protein
MRTNRTIGSCWPTGLSGARVYLAGPRTCLDPAGYAALTSALIEIGLIEGSVEDAFISAARELRTAGALVISPFEQPWWRGAEVGNAELRAAREANASAPARADLVAVLDGWADVPGAVDSAVLAARVAGVPTETVTEALQRAVTGSAALLRRRAS